MTRLYFAYGSNLLKSQMAKRCPGSAPVARAFLPGWRWTIGARGYATIAPAPHEVTHGAIYRITESDETRLDRAEGVAIGCYDKFWLDVFPDRRDGGELAPVRALVYVDPRTTPAEPPKEYLGRCIAGAKGWRLPAEALNLMRAFEPSE